MGTAKEDALNVISSLPKSATMDDIMYRMYVIDKVRKGQEAMRIGATKSIEELKEEITSW